MEPAGPSVRVPALPFTLRAGRRPLQRALSLLRGRMWIVVVTALVTGTVAGVLEGVEGGVLAAVSVLGLVLLVFAAAVPVLLLYGRSTITVTHSELVVRRVRRRVLARAGLAEVVIGWFTVARGDLTSLQVAFVDRQGRRFANLPLVYWAGEELEQLCAALGVSPRWQEDTPRDRLLVPFVGRRPFLSAFGIATVLMALLVGVVVLVETQRSQERATAAARARAQWAPYAERALRTGALPLSGEPEVSSSVPGDSERPVELDVSMALPSNGGEPDPDLVARARSLVCGFRPDLGEVRLRTEVRLSFGSRDGVTKHRIGTACDLDQTPLDGWLRDRDARPLGADVASSDVRLSAWSTAAEATVEMLDVEIRMAVPGRPALRRTMALVCTTAEQQPVARVDYDWADVGPDGGFRSRRHADEVACDDPDAALRQWSRVDR